jgi:glycosyltransferase involved in cell wall biosynthesis
MSRPKWLVSELIYRYLQLRKVSDFDIAIVQREFISTLPTLERCIKIPMVLDVDDAIWLHRGGWAAGSLAKKVDHIVCGNQYLADYFKVFGKPVTIIPTAVDVERFTPRDFVVPNKIIGWSGTSGGFKYLYSIEHSLSQILLSYPDWKLLIVSDQAPDFKLIPESQMEFVLWSVDSEVSTIQKMDIGLMPLDDTPWSRGKCSYKMLLYMACGVPVVVSDVGMNSEVLTHDFIGYGAKLEKDWFDVINKLINSEELRRKAGENGRKVIIDHYSTDVVVKLWSSVLDSVSKLNSAKTRAADDYSNI